MRIDAIVDTWQTAIYFEILLFLITLLRHCPQHQLLTFPLSIKMKVIGLTGSIATGKSTVSKQLSEKNIPIVDADLIAREVVKPGQPALKQIAKTFGSEVLLPDGSLNREKLGSIVFKEPESRKKLNKITHPYIRLEMLRQLLWVFLMGNRIVIMDTPLLLESGINRWVHLVVVVYW